MADQKYITRCRSGGGAGRSRCAPRRTAGCPRPRRISSTWCGRRPSARACRLDRRVPHLHYARPGAAARGRAGARRRRRRGRAPSRLPSIRRYASHPKGSTDYLQGAVVAIDPSSGDVKALVGGRNYQESPFNRAVSGLRQPGSSFKPFVYARALMDSLPANAIVGDTAIDVRYDQQSYRPQELRRQVPGQHHPARGDHALAQSRSRCSSG